MPGRGWELDEVQVIWQAESSPTSFKDDTRHWQHHFNYEGEIVHPKIFVFSGIRMLYVAVRTSGGIYSNIQCKPPSRIQALSPRIIQS